MHIPLSSTTSLTPRPSGKPPSAADCWDMRRAEWIDCTGCAVTAMSRVEANERRTDRRQNDPVRHPRASQTSSDAQRRPPSHADRAAVARAPSRHGASRMRPSTSQRRTVRWWTRGTWTIGTSNVIERCSRTLFDVLILITAHSCTRVYILSACLKSRDARDASSNASRSSFTSARRASSRPARAGPHL